MKTRFTDLNLEFAAIAGGTAGDHTVTGIEHSNDPRFRDELLAVIHLQGDGTQLTGAAVLTDEFSVTANDTINNTGGTATTNGFLIVVYLDMNAE